MATHFFDVDIAIDFGVNAAIILQNIKYWVDHNRANGTNFYDGRYWTFNSVKAFEELFPYMSANTIRNTLNKLQDAGLIVVGNYNKSAYDRTKWYALTEEAEAMFERGKTICQNQQMDFDELTNQFDESNEPIPDINTDRNADDKPKINKRSNDLAEEFEQAWSAYPRKQGKTKAKASFVKARKAGTSLEAIMNGIEGYKRYINANHIEPKYVKQGSTFFNQNSWEDDWQTSGRSWKRTLSQSLPPERQTSTEERDHVAALMATFQV